MFGRPFKIKSMKKFIPLVVILFLSQVCIAQLESAFWYFGKNAALDFNSGSPEIVLNSSMNTLEGCASISNSNGELLFYTDGDTVYNRNHQIMTNGTGLLGHNSSTQSAIIVQKPGSSHLYYIFTADGLTGGALGLAYSEVNMNLDNGNGAVTDIKNIELMEKGDEKVCAIKHQNGQDYWIVAKVGEETIYHAYLLTEQGVDPVPVVSNIGIHNIGIGYLKPSFDGTKIAAAFYNHLFLFPFNSYPFAELYDFDNSTGELSNYQAIDQDIQGYNHRGYGVEFSPNNKLLYVSVEREIFQYNLTAGSTQDIVNSKVVIASANIPDSVLAFPHMAMQLALDGKIYIASGLSFNLHVIESPNEIGAACNFIADHIVLNTNSGSNHSYLGLPAFASDQVVKTPNLSIQSQHHCLGDNTVFSIDSTYFKILLHPTCFHGTLATQTHKPILPMSNRQFMYLQVLVILR